MADGANPRARPANRRAIGVTCAVHRGPRGFANLVLEKQGGEIIFDPHVTGGHRQLGWRPGDWDDRRIVCVEGRRGWAGGHWCAVVQG
ncbi:MAG: hypothetical protein ACRDRQ_19105, partial [Pseudonocardiaceae bacterium]